jgi:hypothetical protein
MDYRFLLFSNRDTSSLLVGVGREYEVGQGMSCYHENSSSACDFVSNAPFDGDFLLQIRDRLEYAV